MAKSDSTEYELYEGPRGDSFRDFIRGLVTLGNIKDEYIDMLSDEISLKTYSLAFTHSSVHEEDNYEVLEQKGDVVANCFIVWYMYNRFPQLKCAKGVKVVARLRINYGSKQSFATIADSLGFWPFISATMDYRDTKKKPLLEDAFEAFVGATQTLLDERVRIGVGYAIAYDILATIFDKMPISLRYEDLYDAKTRLKETFDYFDKTMEAKYLEERGEDRITRARVYAAPKKSHCRRDREGNKIPNRDWEEIGRGSAALKAQSQQAAAAEGLKTMARKGWKKSVPSTYRFFCAEDTGK